MNRDYIKTDEWKIVEQGFQADHITASESLFSLGNGAMGQRANFEETYSGDTFQGSYIAGIYYPDKTRVGWWKNGYPEYFAKVLNAPNWIGINVSIGGKQLDLSTCKVIDFSRELDMRNGLLERSFIAEFDNGNMIKVVAKRFLSLSYKEAGAIKYSVTPINFEGEVGFTPYIDAGIMNEDANYDEFFWEILDLEQGDNEAYIRSKTLKTEFDVCTGMRVEFELNDYEINLESTATVAEKRIDLSYSTHVKTGDTISCIKYGGYSQSMNHPVSELVNASKSNLKLVAEIGFDSLLELQEKEWSKIWKTADITINGDAKAQQAIRFNIFQLNQTYLGEDARLNIGPKGFTGEKYGGSTYWDTEAYCIPFYMSTKDSKVARNLLKYRYQHLDKAIENAAKLGFTKGAALYPMVTMNGEECHNEWEITFEEIHRNGSMVYAIYNYLNYTGDQDYIKEFGMEVIIGVARFWSQRVSYSQDKQAYVMLGVTGPNEYENNVNNNWYTNYLAQWCLDYAIEQWKLLTEDHPEDAERIRKKTHLNTKELHDWEERSKAMYLPYSEEHGVFLQQDGFLDKELIPASKLAPSQRPINQKWSWDRILRSPYIKQADVLQGLYFFEDRFDKESLAKHFDFYEPLTVHESSLSPCVHSILACSIDRIDKAYEMYLRTSRLDLDDYNHEVHEGLHITSMAGTWLSIVQGFGGMRNFNNKLTINPVIPNNWKSYSFKVNYRDHILTVFKSHEGCKLYNESDQPLEITIYGEQRTVNPDDVLIL